MAGMRFIVVMSVPLAACDSPSPAFWSSPPERVEVAGHEFTVRIAKEEAETTRTNTIWPPPDARQVLPAAALAMQGVSGCSVKPGTLSGDAAVQRAELDCGAASPPAREPPLAVTCDVTPRKVAIGPTGDVRGVSCLAEA